MFGKTARERIAFDVERVPEMIDARNQRRTEYLAVGNDAAHRHAAKVHAVVTLLAANEAGAIALAAGTVIAQRNLQRRIDRLRAGVREEAVIYALGRHARDAFGESQRLVVRHLETHAVIELCNLLLHGLDNLRVAMADAGRPKAGERVIQAGAVIGGVPMS